MVFSNQLYPAKPTFQSNKEPNNAGFYTTNKIASTIFCNVNCPYKLNANTNYENLSCS